MKDPPITAPIIRMTAGKYVNLLQYCRVFTIFLGDHNVIMDRRIVYKVVIHILMIIMILVEIGADEKKRVSIIESLE